MPPFGSDSFPVTVVIPCSNKSAPGLLTCHLVSRRSSNKRCRGVTKFTYVGEELGSGGRACGKRGCTARDQGRPGWAESRNIWGGYSRQRGQQESLYWPRLVPWRRRGKGWGLGSCEDSLPPLLTSEFHLHPPAVTEAWPRWLQPSFFSVSQGGQGPLHLTRFGIAGVGA